MVEDAGLFLKAVGFVHNKAVVLVGLGFVEGFGAAEEVIYARAPQRAGQFGRVHKAGRGVARYALRYHFLFGQLDQQVYGYHAFAGAGAAFHYKHVLWAGGGLAGLGQGGFVDYLLVVHHYKFLVALQHAGQAVGQVLAGFYFAVVYAVKQAVPAGPVAVFYIALYELLQLQGVGLKKDRGLFGVLGVERVGDGVVGRVIVQVGAGVKVDLFFLHGGVVVFQQALVGPGLVGRVRGLLRAALEGGYYYAVLGGEVRLLPLL